MGILFIDESGDPGLNLANPNTTEFLAFGAVYFDDVGHYRRWKKMHGVWDRITYRESRGPRREFKFSAESRMNKRSFIRSALEVPGWKWCSLIVIKEWLFGHRDAEGWYRTAAGYLLNNVAHNHAWDHARKKPRGTKVRIDSRHVTKDHRDALMNEVLARRNVGLYQNQDWQMGVFEDPKFVDSAISAGVQLADYIAGASRAAHKSSSADPQWLWEFARQGKRTKAIFLDPRHGYLQVWPKEKPTV